MNLPELQFPQDWGHGLHAILNVDTFKTKQLITTVAIIKYNFIVFVLARKSDR